MLWPPPPYASLFIQTTAIALLVLLIGWRRRATPGGTTFVMLMLAIAIWSAAAALELVAASPAGQDLWARVEYLGFAVVPLLWLVFVVRYTRPDWLPTPRSVALLSLVPLITLALVLTNEQHHLIWTSISPDAVRGIRLYHHGAWYWIQDVYSNAVLTAGGIWLLISMHGAPKIVRRQGLTMLVGALAPWVVNVLYQARLNPIPGLDLTPVGFTITGMTSAWGLFRYHILHVVPVARDALVEGMRDGVLVLNAQGRVMDANPAARAYVNPPGALRAGQAVSQMPDPWPGLLALQADEAESEAEVRLPTGGRRHLNIQSNPLYDRVGRFSGQVLVLRDVTRQKETEGTLARQAQALAALNRTTFEINAQVDLPSLLQAIIDRITELLDVPMGALRLLQPDDQVLERVVSRNMPLQLAESALSVGEGLVGRAAQLGQPVCIDDYRRWPEHRQDVNLPFRRVMALPLQVRGRVIGTVLLADDASTMPFDAGQIQLACLFADQAALAIENARLYSATRQAQEAAESASEMKSAFLASMSHNLKTPLNAILGFSQLLLNDAGLIEDQRAALRSINQGGEFMLNLINQAFEVAQMEQGSDASPPPPSPAVDDAKCLSTLTPGMRARLIEASVQCDFGAIHALAEDLRPNDAVQANLLVSLADRFAYRTILQIVQGDGSHE